MKIHANSQTNTFKDFTSSIQLVAFITKDKKGRKYGNVPMKSLHKKVRSGTATVVETERWYNAITTLIRLGKLYD